MDALRCQVEGCERRAERYIHDGWAEDWKVCGRHAHRYRRRESFRLKREEYSDKVPDLCEMKGCDREPVSRCSKADWKFICKTHWLRVYRHGDPLEDKPIRSRPGGASLKKKKSTCEICGDDFESCRKGHLVCSKCRKTCGLRLKDRRRLANSGIVMRTLRGAEGGRAIASIVKWLKLNGYDIRDANPKGSRSLEVGVGYAWKNRDGYNLKVSMFEKDREDFL